MVLNENPLELFAVFLHFQSFYLLELNLIKANEPEMGT